MNFDDYLRQIRRQAGALREAAVKAGPDTDVPTTPGWTVRHLVAHVARVWDWVAIAFDADPAGPRPRPSKPPEEWQSLLPYMDEKLASMVDGLAERGPAAPAWTFGSNNTIGFWARRQTHEVSIHRLDAEHAAGDVDQLLFEPEMAADGIDEAVTLMLNRRSVEVSGTVLYHAADAGRAWLVTATAGEGVRAEPATELETDASVVGTADAVYRAVWRRPSTAVVGGDTSLVAGLRTP